MKSYWLLKTEGSCYSIDDMKKDKITSWTGIRNYQAKNFMKSMKVGDLCFFYHSSTEILGIYGIVKVIKKSYPDPTQFDKKDEHYDPKSKKEKPIWECVDVKFIKKFPKPITLSDIKSDPELTGISLIQKGSRLSVQPVSPTHFEKIISRSNI